MAEVSSRGVAAAAGGALLAVALAFVSPSEGSHRTDYGDTVRCAGKVVRGVQVRTSSSEAAVFVKPEDWGRDVLPTTYACMRRAGPVVQLDSPLVDASRNPVLAGRYVAYELDPYDGTPSYVEVVDLKEGGTDFADAAMPDADATPARVQALALKRNGSVGWLGIHDETGEQGVWKVDATGGGEPQRLDTGPPAIAPLSFRLSRDRRRLRWLRDDPGTAHTVRDDTPRSAPLD